MCTRTGDGLTHTHANILFTNSYAYTTIVINQRVRGARARFFFFFVGNICPGTMKRMTNGSTELCTCRAVAYNVPCRNDNVFVSTTNIDTHVRCLPDRENTFSIVSTYSFTNSTDIQKGHSSPAGPPRGFCWLWVNILMRFPQIDTAFEAVGGSFKRNWHQRTIINSYFITISIVQLKFQIRY